LVLLQAEGRQASLDELAAEAGIPTERLRQVKRMLPAPASLDAFIDDDSSTTLGELIVDPDVDSPDELVDNKMLADVMASALATLSERERLVLRMHYGLNERDARSMSDISRDLDVTRERVRQIEASAIRKLRGSPAVAVLRHFIH
jgi:RNA polymerase primary sigma factor